MVILVFFSSAVFWKPPPPIFWSVCSLAPLVPYHTTIGKIHTPPPKPPPQPKKP